MYMAKAIFVSVFITTINFVFAQTSYTDCVLNLPMSSTENNSTCGDGNWGGFLKNNCCCEAFNEYLYALGQRAKRGGQIYLNSTEQKNCLVSMRSIEENVLGCGIQKLTSGAPGCSDYSVKDVNTKLGNHLRNLVEDCKHLGSDGQFDQACSTCLRRWEEMGGASGDNKDSKKNEADVCKFAVLVSMASNRIDDKKWNEETQRCLGEQSLPIDERSGRVEKKLSTGDNPSTQ